MAPAIPASLKELIIPPKFTTTLDGKPFLLYDSYSQNQEIPRILIFSTTENLDMMVDCEHLYIDGTFTSSPSIFYQLYTIHGVQYSNVLSSVFALLPNKTEEIYIRLFKKILELRPELNPTSIMLDYEQATINAVKKVLPQTEINGCFFHFCQSIWRHIQNTGLSVKYRENSEFALNIKMLNALAYVPPESVITAFEDLLQTDFYKEHETILTPLLEYFEDTWIGRISRNRQRRSPKFPIK